ERHGIERLGKEAPALATGTAAVVDARGQGVRAPDTRARPQHHRPAAIEEAVGEVEERRATLAPRTVPVVPTSLTAVLTTPPGGCSPRSRCPAAILVGRAGEVRRRARGAAGEEARCTRPRWTITRSYAGSLGLSASGASGGR